MRQVYATLERANGHPGSGRLTEAINAYEPRHLRTRSDLERAFLQLGEKAALPRPNVNATLDPYEVDALWSEQRLVVELDAYGTHGSRRSFESDRIRDGALLEAGYRTLRVTGLRLEREPDAVGRAIERLLG
jgi:very-short-patch-repair endonuclease